MSGEYKRGSAQVRARNYAERLLATRGQPHDEWRTGTILFSDIKGSTAMISQLDHGAVVHDSFLISHF